MPEIKNASELVTPECGFCPPYRKCRQSTYECDGERYTVKCKRGVCVDCVKSQRVNVAGVPTEKHYCPNCTPTTGG